MADEYYKTLGVAKTASQDDIQKAYRKLAKKYHPDLNQNDPKTAKAKFQQVQEAFDVLGNAEKRKVYDQFGVSPDKMADNQYSGGGQGAHQWSYGSGGNPFGGGANPFGGGGSPFGGAGSGMGGFNIEDLLGMFGGGATGRANAGGFGGTGNPFGSAAAPTQGTDIQQSVSIPFTLAVEGGKIDLSFRRTTGHSTKKETIAVKIPQGVATGKKIRLAGLGQPGQNGGKPGNLIITVQVDEHPFFTRRDNNLYVDLPVTLKEAVFGAKVQVPTLKGNVTVTVPAGSSSGTKLRIRGCGVPAKDVEKTGDLFALLSVILPKKWTDEERKLLEKLQTEPDKPVRAALRW